MDAEVHGDVEDLRALGEIHAEEKDVAPRGVREVHAHGRQLAENRVGAVGRTLEQLGAEAERLVSGMTDAEHPLIAPHAADAAADLVSERLEGEPVIGGGERGAEAVAGAVGGLRGEEGVSRLLEAAIQKLFVATEWDEARSRRGEEADFGRVGSLRNPPPSLGGYQLRRQVEAVDGVEEEEGADAFVEVVRAAAEGV